MSRTIEARRDVLADPKVTQRLDGDHRQIGEALDFIEQGAYHRPETFRDALRAIAHLNEVITDAWGIALTEAAS